MKFKLLFATLLLAPVLAFSAQQPRPQLYGFLYYNEAVNPACLALINSNLSRSPFIQQVDLNGCQNTRGEMEVRFNKKGRVFVYKNDKNFKDGGYGYKVIGKAPDGIYVIKTFHHAKGGKVFDNLMLIRLFRQKEYSYIQSGEAHLRDHVALKVVGYVYGGYKCSGGIKSTRLDGNKLYVTSYISHQKPNVCKLTRSYVIDLNGIKN